MENKEQFEPLIFVIKSDDMDEKTIETVREQLKPAFPNKRVAIVCIGKDEDFYAVHAP